MKNPAKTVKKRGLIKDQTLRTRWFEDAKKGNTLKEYPRPSMVRNNWINLNGLWEIRFTNCHERADSERISGKDMFPEFDPSEQILVPFSPECVLSGVLRQLKPDEYLWYHRRITVPAPEKGHHYLLHFGAVDQICTLFINGEEVLTHTGGYLPFDAVLPDVKGTALPSEEMITYEIVLRVRDVSDTSYHSRGKQKLKRGGMFYTAQSGIWQTLWMEQVPNRYIRSVKITPDFDNSCCHVKVLLQEIQPSKEAAKKESRPVVTLHEGTAVVDKKEGASVTLHIPLVHAWSPEDPYLYGLTVTAGDDQVECYVGMRIITKELSADGHLRFFLNHKEYLQIGVLDQGYWPDGLYTAPSDEAMIYDIQAMKETGCNMIRKHIKIEPDRWYYHCDRLGMLVWQDMVNGGNTYKSWFVTYLATAMNTYHISVSDGPASRWLLSRTSRRGRKEFLSEMRATVKCLYNHPCIVTWVPFNEAWGQFDARKTCELLRRLDPTRMIDHASGWFDQKAGDVISLHYYFFKLRFTEEKNRVLSLTEYGGYSLRIPGHCCPGDMYGYGSFTTQEELQEACRKRHDEIILPAVKKGVSALVYTQLSDVEDETNGILTYDREIVKLPDLFRSVMINPER